jgi:hypothetical protein
MATRSLAQHDGHTVESDAPAVPLLAVVGGVVLVEFPDPEVVFDDEGALELHDARISVPTATATAPRRRITLMWPTFRPIETSDVPPATPETQAISRNYRTVSF